MLIFERGTQRYVVDSDSGLVTLFDPTLHDAEGQVAPAKRHLRIVVASSDAAQPEAEGL